MQFYIISHDFHKKKKNITHFENGINGKNVSLSLNLSMYQLLYFAPSSNENDHKLQKKIKRFFFILYLNTLHYCMLPIILKTRLPPADMVSTNHSLKYSFFIIVVVLVELLISKCVVIVTTASILEQFTEFYVYPPNFSYCIFNILKKNIKTKHFFYFETPLSLLHFTNKCGSIFK